MDFGLLAPLGEVLDGLQPQAAIAAGVVARLSGILFLLPGIGERAVPQRVRLAALFAFAAVIAPSIIDSAMPPQLTPAAMMQYIFAEIVTGLVIGFALRLTVIALQIAGSIIAQHLSLSQMFGAGVGYDAESAFATILVMGALALAMSGDFLLLLTATLTELWTVLPAGRPIEAASVGEWSAAAGGGAWRIALALSAPFVVLGFLYSLALAAASRAMPQLMAAFVGAPAITFAGLALFALTAIVILDRWMDLTGALFSNPFGFAP